MTTPKCARVVGLVLDVVDDCPVHGKHAGTNAPGGTDGGPAKVTSDEYRSGWDRIFGAKPERGIA